ncbi:septum formation inhibitor Maf [Pseudomethylobacillus aquaticus]|uniref:dTTP/UTP pyrophosphatase n=1 Tax=Pseudomethylobacillus aquaticus TaxID=2676064 RepID=A0A3N0V460_9PROT|nr:nucleoside triphosphate pyrophosphatase [Pseudomethylobacillus aquaticus]ROH87268.1 septum formation inhibitor Maf [Pseudomethylobacillus aquaticus]
MTTSTLYLASRSPRRAEILKAMGVPFILMLSDIDESVHAGEAPDAYVLRLAAGKAAAGLQQMQAEQRPALPLLAADTTVCIDGDILGKPEDAPHAAAMLRRLSGRWHEVHTGIALASASGIQTALSSTRVLVDDLDEAAIAAYIASGEPYGKAGAYGIQGLASMFIRRIEGSYSGVMGLPVFETAQLLRNAGLRLPGNHE